MKNFGISLVYPSFYLLVGKGLSLGIAILASRGHCFPFNVVEQVLQIRPQKIFKRIFTKGSR